MLSHLDRIIFPDRCEVIEVIPSQRYVYPIFKNGHSSFVSAKRKNKWPVQINQQIQKLKQIDIIIRNPEDRLISGINTYIHFTIRDNLTLDQETVQWFALNHLYLNRHYCPQFLWILNIARYLDIDTKLNFLPMSEIGIITGFNKKPVGISPASDELIKKIKLATNNEMYQRIDAVIFECIGQSLTFKELLQQINTIDPDAYNYVIVHSQQILNPTYVLS